jgi:crotonobetainyl-CoA:carnitine CoA-transferase CaiB-like acyl-CoA transferase
MRALNGLLVLDLTRLLPGAVATQTLAAHGARVIKIEQPGVGDYARHGFTHGGVNPIFAATNRGKESIELDLKDEDGRNALRVLAMEADVLIEGFRPGVMHRLGIDYEHLRGLNPRLIYVALTGYGQQGERAQMAGHDINYLALAGVLNEIGTAEMPVVPGVQLADLAGGSMQVVIGTLLALQARERTGEGQFVDVSMTDGVASLLPIPLSSYGATGELPARGDALLTGRYACYGVYRAAAGFVAVGALEPKFWQNLCEALDERGWIGDQFAEEPRRSELKRLLGARLLERTAEEWFAMLREKDCCVSPVRDLVEARPCVEPVPRLGSTPGAFADDVPRLGEHTAAVLKEFGLDVEDLERT